MHKRQSHTDGVPWGWISFEKETISVKKWDSEEYKWGSMGLVRPHTFSFFGSNLTGQK